MNDIANNLDPQTMATQLAKYDVMALQSALKIQQGTLKNQQGALSALKTAMTDFRTALTGMNKSDNGMLQNSATLNQEGFLTAKASSSASKGTYNIFVEQTASASQLGFENLTDEEIANASGKMDITIDGETISIDMDSVGTLNELANAINTNGDNPGVTASLMRSDGKVMMTLTSDETGEKNQIDLDTSGITGTGTDAFNETEMTKAQDAIVHMGSATGPQMTSGTGIFKDLIKGVTLEVTAAQKAGDSPLQLRVGTDETETTAQVQKFVDAYNALRSQIDELTTSGSDGKGRGAFAGDSGINALTQQLNNMLRDDFNGKRITDFGISAGKDGKLKLDSEKFTKALTADPDGVTGLFNGSGGLVKSMDKSLDGYLSSTNGMLKMRQETLDRKESQLTDKADQINTRYDNSYNRYLKQFTELQKVMSQMNNTMSMFGLA